MSRLLAWCLVGPLTLAIRIKPDDADAHYNLGVAYVQLDRYEEGIDAFKQAIRIQWDLAKAHHAVGGAYWMVGDKEAALDEHRILKELDRNLANELSELICH